ncbi:MAG TPA: GntR family transcriptional regulator [Clostridia bacterium]|nr:GntR family transcriptional regulator [Clostridia bacterium]
MVEIKKRESTVSLSQEVKKQILEYIERNDLQPNDKLPSENQLTKLFKTSRYTLREALALLKQERIIYKIKGKGTFVNKKPIQIKSGLEYLDSITEIIKKFGYVPGTKWVSIEEKSPTKDMIEKLNLKSKGKVITFKRIRTANGKPAAFLVDTVAKKVLGNRKPEIIIYESLFDYLEKEFGIIIEYAVSEIIPAFSTDEMIKYMGVEKNSLFLLLYQLHYDREGRPIIYSFDYFDPEVFKFKVIRSR